MIHIQMMNLLLIFSRDMMYIPGLRSLVLQRAMVIRILLRAVRILLWSGGRAGEMSPVAGIMGSPVPVPLSGVRWWVGLVPVLLRILVVVLTVLGSVGVVASGVTSMIHVDLLTQDQPT